MRRLLGRLAAGAPVPVLAVAGEGARDIVQDLQLEDALRPVESPREASVLLVAGALPRELEEPLRRSHDAMPHPRCTVWNMGGARRDDASLMLPGALFVDDPGAIVPAVVRAYRELLDGGRASEPSLLPDVDPTPWRGVGPYGQGGAGMTGGIPYGRPMAELADDRDGLRLDVLPVRVGPFFPRFPAGLVLNVDLAGDVIVGATLESYGAGGAARVSGSGAPPDAFTRALSESVPVAVLELARARSHLRWVAGALAGHGLPALGRRVLHLATRLTPRDVAEVRQLARLVEWTQMLRWTARGVAPIDGALITGLGAGPVARASGLAEDERLDDPAYQALDFRPIVHPDGDAAARWRQRLAEAVQSLDLAVRAGDRSTAPRGRVECPRGRLEPGRGPSARLLPLVPGLIAGQEWGDAVTAIVSLDLDIEETTIQARPSLGARA